MLLMRTVTQRVSGPTRFAKVNNQLKNRHTEKRSVYEAKDRFTESHDFVETAKSSDSAKQLLPEQDHLLTLSEALAILEHLSERGLLCQKCGYKWADLENQFNRHCNGCRNLGQEYRITVKKGSDFERLLCERLQRYVDYFVQADGSGSGDPSDSKGHG